MNPKITLSIALLVFVAFSAIISQTPNMDVEGASLESMVDKSSEVDWWPMFQHDPAHTGHSLSKIPEKNETLWVSLGPYATPHSWCGFAPAVVDGRAVITGSSGVFCFNASTGLKLWQFDARALTVRSPAIWDGKVFVGFGGNDFFCLNVTNGKLIWKYTAGNYLSGHPVAYNGRVFITGWSDGRLYCLNETNGLLLWKYNLGYPEVGQIHDSPTIEKNRILISSRNFSSGWKLFCLDINMCDTYSSYEPNKELSVVWNGTQIWKYRFKSEPSFAVYSEGKVFIGTASPSNTFFCLNDTSGEQIWNYKAEGAILHTAIANDRVFVVDQSNNTYCLNASNGSLIWKHEMGSSGASPAIADGKLILTVGSELHVMNETNGEHIWSYNPPEESGFESACVAIADGRIYIASRDNKLYCFGPMIYYDINIAPTFYDNLGDPLAPSPSSWVILFPNGTKEMASRSIAFYGSFGNYSIVNVTWRGNEVLRNPVCIFVDSDMVWNPRIDCLLPTSIFLSLRSSTSLVGFKVETKGNITCNEESLSGTPLLLSYSVNGGETWNDIMLVKTDSEGSYSEMWMPPSTGNYLVKATWSGNITYPRTTTIINFAMTSFEEYMFSVSSNSTVSSLAFNNTSRELCFFLSGAPETTGYANVYIAKALVSNVANIKVYLNKSKVDPIVMALDDSWFVFFKCTHSICEVTIYLGSVSTPLSGMTAVMIASIVITVAVILISLYVLRKRFHNSRKTLS